jgi:hypothetical protein
MVSPPDQVQNNARVVRVMVTLAAVSAPRTKREPMARESMLVSSIPEPRSVKA